MTARKKASQKKTKRKATTRAKRKPANRKRGGGRPKVVIDLESLRPLIALGCSHDEIADCLGIARSTFQLRLAEDPKLADAVGVMKGERKRMVRAWMTRAASNGNARILIHMASHELGQRPVKAIEVSGPDGGPIELNQELRPLLEEKLTAYIRSKANGGG